MGAPAGIESRARSPGSAGASNGSERWPFRTTEISAAGTCSASATCAATARLFVTNPAASRPVRLCAAATSGVCQKPRSRRETSTGVRDGRAATGPTRPASPMNVWTRSKRRADSARESDRSRGTYASRLSERISHDREGQGNRFARSQGEWWMTHISGRHRRGRCSISVANWPSVPPCGFQYVSTR